MERKISNALKINKKINFMRFQLKINGKFANKKGECCKNSQI